MNNNTRSCIHCGVSLAGRHGVAKMCIDCSSAVNLARATQWQLDHREQVKEYQRKKYQERKQKKLNSLTENV